MMTLRCLFGQMPESYEGEHAPELLLAVDEFVLEDNPEYWDKEKKRVLSGGYESNFMSIREIEIEVDQEKIRDILLAAPVLEGKIL